MSITGTKQGLITAGAFTEDSVGNTYQEGHEDQVMVQGFNHEVIIPRDPQSGQPTGQRVHKPVVITKVFDKASPLLLAALTSGERLTKVEIQWYRTSAAGTQEHYYTTVLEDAIIVDIKDYMHNCQDPGNAHFTHLEDVHFTYRKITWTHEVSGTSGSDDWRSAGATDRPIRVAAALRSAVRVAIDRPWWVPLRQEISFRSSGNAFAFYFRDRNAQGAQLLEDVHEFAVALDLAVFKFEGMQEVVFVISFGISGEKNLAVTVAFDPEMIGVVGSEYIYVVPLPIGKALQ